MQAFIRIDTQLKPSRYRIIVWGLVGFLSLLLLSQLTIAISYQILLGVVVLISMWFGQIASYHLIACASLPESQAGHRLARHQRSFDFLQWHLQLVHGVLVVPWHQPQDVWQAKLKTIIDMGGVMLMNFDILQPYQRQIWVTVWQDQVEQDIWRQLKILAR